MIKTQREERSSFDLVDYGLRPSPRQPFNFSRQGLMLANWPENASQSCVKASFWALLDALVMRNQGSPSRLAIEEAGHGAVLEDLTDSAGDQGCD
jgi:hypothetical protein